MTVHVRLFAILRERAGTDHVELDLPEPATVADAIAALARVPGLDALGGAGGAGVRIAVNREYAELTTPLKPSDALAAIPPVSGGAPDADADSDELGEMTIQREGAQAAITRGRLDHEPLIQYVQSEHAGAVVTFAGYPRDIPALDYEAYTEMAVERMFAILSAARERHGLTRVAAEHRIGTVQAFEASILIAVSAPHRGEAFSGAREILDRIKAEAPIWKVEVDARGDRHRPEGTVPR